LSFSLLRSANLVRMSFGHLSAEGADFENALVDPDDLGSSGGLDARQSNIYLAKELYQSEGDVERPAFPSWIRVKRDFGNCERAAQKLGLTCPWRGTHIQWLVAKFEFERPTN
jgi:hypothetical protein